MTLFSAYRPEFGFMPDTSTLMTNIPYAFPTAHYRSKSMASYPVYDQYNMNNAVSQTNTCDMDGTPMVLI